MTSLASAKEDAGRRSKAPMPRSQWKRKPLRYLCRLNPTKSEVSHLPGDTEVSFVPMEAVHEYGGLDLSQSRAIETVSQGYTYFRDDDVLIAKITPCFENGKGSLAASLEGGIGFGTTELHVLRCGEEIDPRFLFYLTLSHDFRHRGAGWMYGAGGQKRVPEEFLRKYLAAFPARVEQQAIAAWLDDRTKRIDELIAAKRGLIELLAEQRTALITRAVTKGFDPAVPMKPSGVDWLGDVPAHWEVKRLRFSLRSIEQGWSPQCDSRPVEGSAEWGVLKVGCVNGAEFDDSQNKALPVGLDPHPEYEIKPGDVLMSRANTRELLGSAAYVHSVRPRLHLCDKLYRIRTDPKHIDPRFLVFSFRAHSCRFQLEREADGASGSMKNIGQDTLKNCWIPLPPVNEQRVIVENISTVCAKLSSVAAASEAAIERLGEYRQALITAAVTGQVKVVETSSHGAEAAGSFLFENCVPSQKSPTRKGRKANKPFQRSVLAAEIVAAIGDNPTFGKVKLQKTLLLAEYHLRLDEIKSEPRRAAAGPFDNRMMRSIHSQLSDSQWYEYDPSRKGGKYAPLAKVGGHKQYFDRYWSDRRAGFDDLMRLLAKMKTEQSEIVATLYAAWNDFVLDGKLVDDEAIVSEVLTRWDPAKERISADRWLMALDWMHEKRLVPTGYGAHTKAGALGDGA